MIYLIQHCSPTTSCWTNENVNTNLSLNDALLLLNKHSLLTLDTETTGLDTRKASLLMLQIGTLEDQYVF